MLCICTRIVSHVRLAATCKQEAQDCDRPIAVQTEQAVMFIVCTATAGSGRAGSLTVWNSTFLQDEFVKQGVPHYIRMTSINKRSAAARFFNRKRTAFDYKWHQLGSILEQQYCFQGHSVLRLVELINT